MADGMKADRANGPGCRRVDVAPAEVLETPDLLAFEHPLAGFDHRLGLRAAALEQRHEQSFGQSGPHDRQLAGNLLVVAQAQTAMEGVQPPPR
jgi:hypothetical protein